MNRTAQEVRDLPTGKVGACHVGGGSHRGDRAGESPRNRLNQACRCRPDSLSPIPKSWFLTGSNPCPPLWAC